MLIRRTSNVELTTPTSGALAARLQCGFIGASSVPFPAKQRLPQVLTEERDLGRRCILEGSTILTVVDCDDGAFRETSAARWIGARRDRRTSLWPRTFRVFPTRLTLAPLAPLGVRLAPAKNNGMSRKSSRGESKSMNTRNSCRAARLALKRGAA